MVDLLQGLTLDRPSYLALEADPDLAIQVPPAPRGMDALRFSFFRAWKLGSALQAALVLLGLVLASWIVYLSVPVGSQPGGSVSREAAQSISSAASSLSRIRRQLRELPRGKSISKVRRGAKRLPRRPVAKQPFKLRVPKRSLKGGA